MTASESRLFVSVLEEVGRACGSPTEEEGKVRLLVVHGAYGSVLVVGKLHPLRVVAGFCRGLKLEWRRVVLARQRCCARSE